MTPHVAAYLRRYREDEDDPTPDVVDSPAVDAEPWPEDVVATAWRRMMREADRDAA